MSQIEKGQSLFFLSFLEFKFVFLANSIVLTRGYLTKTNRGCVSHILHFGLCFIMGTFNSQVRDGEKERVLYIPSHWWTMSLFFHKETEWKRLLFKAQFNRGKATWFALQLFRSIWMQHAVLSCVISQEDMSSICKHSIRSAFPGGFPSSANSCLFS